MKKSIIIWSVAIILVITAFYVTKNYSKELDAIINPPQQKQQTAQGAATPTPGSAQTNNGGQPAEQQETVKTNLMGDYDFELEDLNGNKVSLSDFKGKKVFLNFWATWCPPCKAEMPDIEKLYQETKDTELVILAVNVGEDKKTVQDFIIEKGYNFPVLLDVKGEISQMYQVTGIPTTYLIDTKGYLDDGATGAITLEAMKEFVNNLE